MIFFLIIFILLIIISTIFIIVFFTILIQELWYGQKKNAPFVPAPDAIMCDLNTHITIDENSVVYDLGAGDGKVLQSLYEYNKKGAFVGIERGFVPYVLARIKQRNIPNISFKRQDFFDTDLSSATTVMTYLYPRLMDALLPKLEKDLKSGTLLYSIDFPFSEKKPMEVYEFDQTRRRGRKLFKYIF